MTKMTRFEARSNLVIFFVSGQRKINFIWEKSKENAKDRMALWARVWTTNWTDKILNKIIE